MKRLRWVGVFLGAGLFLWILHTSDLAAVWHEVRRLQWRFAVVFLFYIVIFGLDTLGWKYALSSRSKTRIRWDHLFRTRLAGEAVNYMTPSAWVGGEPVKALLLSKRYGVPLSEGMASVVVAKTTFSFSMLLFILMGLGVVFMTQSIPSLLSRWIWVVLGGLTFSLALFLVVQFLKPFQRGSAFLRRLAPGCLSATLCGGANSILSKVKEWDHSIASFYRHSPGALFCSLSFHFLGWMAGVIEVYLILRFLHIPVSLFTAWSIEALWILLKSGAFLIPASLGASEGLLLLICVGLGINTVSGLALGLIRRARELVWMSLGLVEFSRG